MDVCGRSFLLTVTLGFLPAIAWAGDGKVTVPPLVVKSVDQKLANAASASLAMELDFSGSFESVDEMKSAPSGWGASCLTSTSCLAGVAKAAGADFVFGGSIGTGSQGLQLYLVLYDKAKNTIVRKNTYDLPAEQTAVADAANRIVKEMTGGAPAATSAAAAPKSEHISTDFSDESDDFAMENPNANVGNTRMQTTSKPRALADDEDDAAAAAAAKAKADAEAKAKAKAEADAKAKAAAEAKAKADAEAKAAAEAEARRKAAAAEAERLRLEQEAEAQREREEQEAQEEAARQEAAAAKARADAAKSKTAAAPPADFADFELGAIVVEEDSATEEPAVEEEPPPPPPKPKSSSSSSSSRTAAPKPAVVEEDPEEDFNPPSREEDPVVDLDEDPPPSKSKSSSSSSSRRVEEDPDEDLGSSRSSSRDEEEPSRSSSRDEEPPARSARTQSLDLDEGRATRNNDSDDKPGITLATRVGYCRLSSLNFICYGPELAVPLSQSVNSAQLVVGVEGLSTQRHFTDEEVTRIAQAQTIATGQTVDPSEIDPNPWNTIVPINLGIQYKYAGGNIHPYVGANLVVVPNAVNTSAVEGESKSNMIFGPQGLAGVDFMVSQGFGFNLDLRASYLLGGALGMVDDSLQDKGVLVPQLSGGTVFRF